MHLRSIIRPLAVAVSLASHSVGAIAHDIVLVPSATAITVRYGHPGDWLPVDIEKILSFQRIEPAGKTIDQGSSVKSRGLTLVTSRSGAAPGLYAARYDNGLWVQTPGPAGSAPQFRNASRFMVPEASETLASFKFAKAFAGNRSDETLYKTDVAHLLELIPQKNPLALASGEPLPVLVKFNGKPLAGAGIEVGNLIDKIAEDKIERYRTDANGIASVTVRPRGLNVMAVDFERPNDGTLGEKAKELPVQKLMFVATYAFIR